MAPPRRGECGTRGSRTPPGPSKSSPGGKSPHPQRQTAEWMPAVCVQATTRLRRRPIGTVTTMQPKRPVAPVARQPRSIRPGQHDVRERPLARAGFRPERDEQFEPLSTLSMVTRSVGDPSAPKSVFSSRICAESMERLWSLAGATSGNWWQMRRSRKQLKQAETVATACDQLPIGAHGKEGVDGGFQRAPARVLRRNNDDGA
jgi:uncharacterized protein YjiS (DUF1127 family)